ncbi:Cqd2p NDAI_0G05250 [Naumovozyma dairenensis CBS 421]|uniref:ABC1 atypical kinase-like domain-containing protein n=1 Tax=Naumovozyma dairenensis (strain ATCC 10597 / BCRC 20456 / CBS 421 / NBRC 0211 / NRRL Y-12639) TaxID=1071378 RepID=J7SB31_NAUDC|nr:hypothetical protein NDAI_0G05250 [Naumovozyma dairenensis CBS 421]CCK73508.1 hypothetical protein NDAI_0G05250 [Naumovozyma dairenensis CBS 421]
MNILRRSGPDAIRRYAKLSPHLKKRRHRTQLLLATALTSGLLLYETNDSVHESFKHTYLTMKRVSIVGQATIRCFYHYKRTLNKEYATRVSRMEALNACHLKCARITLKALEWNGGVYIKLGQHIGAMTYLLPREWTETMVPLQDQCPQSTMEEINEMFLTDLGQSIDDLFDEFDPRPIGVASLAQVHVGKLKASSYNGKSVEGGNGDVEKVAIKCQHPTLKNFIPLDVILTKTVFKFMDLVFPEYPLTWLSDELQSSIYVELDFTKEAQNAIKTSNYFKNFENLTALKVPKVVSAQKRILIMEYVGGKRLDDLKYLDDSNISRAEVSACLSHIFNNMIFTPNVGIHCDPHGGNLAIRYRDNSKKKLSWKDKILGNWGDNKSENRHNFEIILFDHGLYRYPTTQMRRDYAKFWLALLDQKQDKMKYYAKKFAYITDEEFPMLAAAITGRSIDTALHLDISKKRSQEEMDVMSEGIIEGTLLADLMGILSKIPSSVLLILKTNDLTRHLDECLQNPLGPERTFLIMSQYCAKTVYDEECENIQIRDKRWSLIWSWHKIVAWLRYERRQKQLVIFDLYLLGKQTINLIFMHPLWNMICI